jgi:hypothetical protein
MSMYEEFMTVVCRNSFWICFKIVPSKMRPGIVGGLHRCSDEQTCSDELLQQLDLGERKEFLMATRIFEEGHVFFGAVHKRMEKKVCNVIILDCCPPAVASVKLFFAVYSKLDIVDIDSTSPFFLPGVTHLVRVHSLNKEAKIIPVALIKEKLLYISCDGCTCIC